MLSSADTIDGSIIMGDFNCYPNEPCYKYFTSSRCYVSAYNMVHGCEPIKTFHQDHDCITKDIDEESTLGTVLACVCCYVLLLLLLLLLLCLLLLLLLL